MKRTWKIQNQLTPEILDTLENNSFINDVLRGWLNYNGVPEFSNEIEAKDWMDSKELEYVDNERFAYIDNEEELKQYQSAHGKGCCGYFDVLVKIDNKFALIGCNYGH